MDKTYCQRAWVIDDEEMSIFYTENLLKFNNFTSDVRSFTNPQEALTELESLAGSEEFPEFIFLDLNMPSFDGWDFLKAYREFPKDVRESCTLYILSSSVDENDIKNSKLHEDVRDFLTKPLNKMSIEVIKFQNPK